MVSFKKRVVRLLFCLEILFFLGNFLFSRNGLRAIMSLKKENENLCSDIEMIKHSVAMLEQELFEWHSAYKREKVAREQLHMARSDEMIYFLS